MSDGVAFVGVTEAECPPPRFEILAGFSNFLTSRREHDTVASVGHSLDLETIYEALIFAEFLVKIVLSDCIHCREPLG